MNALDIKKLAEAENLDIEGHILGLPIERQQVIAKQLGYEDFEFYVKAMIADYKETQQFSDETEIVHFDTVEEAQKAGYTVPRWHNESINARPIH